MVGGRWQLVGGRWQEAGWETVPLVQEGLARKCWNNRCGKTTLAGHFARLLSSCADTTTLAGSPAATDGEVPTFTKEQGHLKHLFNSNIRRQVSKATREESQEVLQQHAKGLELQGHLLTLAAREKEDLFWKSSMFQLKAGTLKFMINASIDTLPTPANYTDGNIVQVSSANSAETKEQQITY